MTAQDERVWAYLLKNRQATLEDIVLHCDISLGEAEEYIDRISSPNWREEIKTTFDDLETWMEGVKFDTHKPRMDLLPPELDTAVATVLTFGAAKYGDRNWENGMAWGRAYAAMRRHMNAWWSGEDNDPESGMPHTWHAACCVAFLIAYQSRGIGRDDRNKLEVKSHAGMAGQESTGTKVSISRAYTEHDPVSESLHSEGDTLRGGAAQTGRDACAAGDGVRRSGTDTAPLQLAGEVQAVRGPNGSGFVPVDL